MAYYKDLREYIEVLERKGKLVRIRREIDKDTELHPLVRLQFRGLPENERTAFFFEKVVDAKGRKYASPVLVAAHAASTEMYALAMMCEPGGIMKKWEEAYRHPTRPKVVNAGAVQEEVHVGDTLLEHGGLDEFPIPISTPGFDNAPYLSAGNWVSKNPDTGVINVGNYRGMVKSQLRLGCMGHGHRHIGLNFTKYKEKGLPKMPAAVVIGPNPNIGLVAVTKIPYAVEEYDIAGAIAGEPVELVKCKTIDLEVPATAEIVIEGEMSTEYLEVEGPFGEYTGYMGMGGPSLFLDVTCITHRKQPIWNAFLSQFPPSESSTLRGVGSDAALYKFLKYDLSIHNLVDASSHRNSGSVQFCVLSLKNANSADVWKALKGADALHVAGGKMIVAVDDDIDVRDLDSVIWAMCYRMQPARDVLITSGKRASLDPSGAPPDELREDKNPPITSSILFDATRKWAYPPVALPRKEFMERARKIWEEEGLPPLRLKVPWFGYSLGYWTEEDEEQAELALQGEHYRTGEKQSKERIKE